MTDNILDRAVATGKDAAAEADGSPECWPDFLRPDYAIAQEVRALRESLERLLGD